MEMESDGDGDGERENGERGWRSMQSATPPRPGLAAENAGPLHGPVGRSELLAQFLRLRDLLLLWMIREMKSKNNNEARERDYWRDGDGDGDGDGDERWKWRDGGMERWRMSAVSVCSICHAEDECINNSLADD
ncbi:hypothetical protein H109_06467 [Trichophyton interdigitale MR816]|uniref:Uncharacterized protein n=1 Tax=Trichophyton interdigitale (strain MR816) TaxID=1215338 RepID=A0A059J1E4_TRIIM|nr:hypothetical protein H109_06467 [Trichophyton interdigitale MR816]